VVTTTSKSRLTHRSKGQPCYLRYVPGGDSRMRTTFWKMRIHVIPVRSISRDRHTRLRDRNSGLRDRQSGGERPRAAAQVIFRQWSANIRRSERFGPVRARICNHLAGLFLRTRTKAAASMRRPSPKCVGTLNWLDALANRAERFPNPQTAVAPMHKGVWPSPSLYHRSPVTTIKVI
jgi:hypothetical protein